MLDFAPLWRGIRLVWQSAPGWTVVRLGILVLQGLLPLAALYLCLRLLGKTVGGVLAARMAADEPRPPLRLGLGLVSQGGIAVAMVMNYYQLSSAAMTDVVVNTVLIAVILNELASPSLVRNVLREAGEIGP